ncbi:MAG: PhzF family phenazine biosynthesis protein [Pseudomonadota bacterium]
MKGLRFRQVDVFTSVPFRGNPVAVVLDGSALADEQMQRIAAWTNLSETTFVLPPSSPAADYRLRIFTPRAELPFAGHPTIGSAHAVLEAGIVKAGGARLRQECGAGIVELVPNGGTIWLKAPSTSVSSLDPARIPDLEKSLGGRAIARPLVVDVGPVWIVAELGDAEIVGNLRPDMAALGKITDAAGATGVTVFGKSSDGESAIHVRSFAPAHGVAEDPVCGSGNISVAAYFRHCGRPERAYTARQGMQLGRDGRVSVRIDADGIQIGGEAVTCVEGTLAGQALGLRHVPGH